MIKKQVLLVGGCSFTHGCETYNGFMHSKNVENSYSHHLAKQLDVDLINLALSGASNDYIFFSLASQLRKRDPSQIHSVIAAWTNVNRLTWRCQDRYWLYNAPWSTTSRSLAHDQLEFSDWGKNIEKGGVWFNVDDNQYLDSLMDTHKFFIDNYLCDTDELNEKLFSYSESLRAMCQTRNIKLIELQVYGISSEFSGYRIKTPHNKHPTAQEHEKIAQELYQEFYC